MTEFRWTLVGAVWASWMVAGWKLYFYGVDEFSSAAVGVGLAMVAFGVFAAGYWAATAPCDHNHDGNEGDDQ